MRRALHLHTAIWCILLFAMHPTVHAKPIIHYYIRDLTALADVVVVADLLLNDPEPNPTGETSFKVVEVLMGKNIAVGDTIKILYSSARSKNPDYVNEPTPKVTRALLYLQSAATRAKNVDMGKAPPANPFWLVTSGERYLSADNAAYTPFEGMHGETMWTKYKDATWEKLLDHARSEAKAVAPVKELLAHPDPAVRNKGLFEWIGRHKSEFEIGKRDKINFNRDDFTTIGWGDLEQSTFEAISKSGVPEDAWNALVLFAGIVQNFRDYQTRFEPSSFSTKAGRAFLLGRAGEASIPAEQRRFALEKLLYNALHPLHFGNGTARFEPMTEDEKGAILMDLTKPLEDPAAPVREMAAQAIERMYMHVRVPDVSKFGRPALESLAKAYKKEAPGSVRTWIAKVLNPLCSEDEWKELTGNPKKMLVIANITSKQFKPSDKITLLLDYRGPVASPMSPPRFKAERLDEKGAVLRTQEFSFGENLRPGVSLKTSWGYNIQTALLIEAGTWRISAAGTAGENGALNWTSEAHTFEVKESLK